MDLREFAASLIGSLAWPLTVTAAVLLLRHQIAGLLPALRRLRIKDVELEFGRAVEELKKEAETEELPTPRELPDMPVERLAVIADVSPRAAILEAWLYLESACLDAAEGLGLLAKGRKHTGLSRIATGLQEHGRMTNQTRGLFERVTVRAIGSHRVRG